jgi:antitoxin ChpS
MHTTSLRKVGGSVMLTVPPAILDLLHLQAGATVEMEIDNGRLVIAPQARRRYDLVDLLAQCDASAAISGEDQAWLNDGPVGGELL